MFMLGLRYLAFSLFGKTVFGRIISSNATAPVVDLGYAQYQGYFDAQRDITHFLGIRYAAPPIGHLRFQAPQAPAYESGVQDATQNPSECYQTLPGQSIRRRGTVAKVSEDCLFLNVFVPTTTIMNPVTSDCRPVLVWIHGGGYQSGSAAQYNGADLVVESSNTVVVVVIQYRLGAFGFLAGDEVKAHGALNAGLLDQNFALQWVQEHIESFGGNKNHVTIWGESAGAGSVLQHIVAHGGSTQPPLFNAVITSSTFMPSQYEFNDRVPQMLYHEVVSRTGCVSSVDTFACLQSVDAETLEEVNVHIAESAFYDTFVFVPVIDGAFIVERPTVTLSKGQVNGHVLLAITNQNEGVSFVNVNETLGITQYIARLFSDLTFQQIQEAASVYQQYDTPVEQAMMVYGDAIFICPTYYLLETFAGRSWKGLFAVPPALHGEDGFYYFYDASNRFLYHNMKFINAFSQSFMSVIRYYDVNRKLDPTNITPHWNKYVIGETEMLFNRTEAGKPVVSSIQTDPSLLWRCEFWSRVTAGTAQ